MRKPLLLTSILAALSSPSALYAQPFPVVLTLEDAQARAVAASHRLAEVQSREQAALAAVRAREAAGRPLVSAAAGYTRTNHVTEFVVPGPGGLPRVIWPDVPNNYRSGLSLQWPIYSGGRTDALERAARAEAAAVAAEIEIARADLRLEVARAYWAVATAGATVGVLEQNVARTRAHLGEVRERFEAGLVPPNEIASAEAQEARARMLLIEARNQREASGAELARLAGIDPGLEVSTSATLESMPPMPIAAEALLSEARSSRDERRAMERRIDAAEEQRAAADAARRPTVAVAGLLDYARPNPRIFPRTDQWQESWEAGVNVAWTLWDGGRTAADAAAAASVAAAARSRLAEFDSLLGVEVRQRLLDVDSGRAAVSAAGEGVRAAAEARRVVTERYRAGVATQTEVLDAEFALLQAELDRTRALASVRLSEARLDRAAGR